MTELKHALELICNPFFILVFLLFLSIFWVKRKPQLASKLFLMLGCFTLMFSTGWLPKYLTNRLESTYPVVNQANPQIKWVVVLGGGHYIKENASENNLLTGISIKRLVEGIRLLRQLPQAQLVLSGGGESPQLTEASLLAKLSEWFSIPKTRIVLEDKTLNTAQQAKALATLLHKEPFYLVTSAIHMPRSMQLCKQLGLNPIAAPTDFTYFWSDGNEAKMLIPNAYNVHYLNIAFHELLGRLWLGLYKPLNN